MISLESIRGFFPEELRAGQFAKHILKEYVECLALEWIARSPWAAKLTFIGGTNLRLTKDIDRFSEDLDFDCKGLAPDDFIRFTDALIAYLVRNGLNVVAKEKESSRLTAMRRSIMFPGLLHDLGLSAFKEERFMMKIEAQDQGITYIPETAIINRNGFLFSTSVPPKGVLLSMKLSALLARGKGRDFYDTIFLWQQTEPDYDFLSKRCGISTPEELRDALVHNMSETSLADKQKDFQHLLFANNTADKILLFNDFFESKLNK